jgi:hypothetical protein
MIISIDTQGNVRGIYTDDFPWLELGKALVQRASNVEPDHLGLWWADLSLSNGPKIGPFARRADAIAAEIAWLEKHRL